jgi:hypothetical protein
VTFSIDVAIRHAYIEFVKSLKLFIALKLGMLQAKRLGSDIIGVLNG